MWSRQGASTMQTMQEQLHTLCCCLYPVSRYGCTSHVQSPLCLCCCCCSAGGSWQHSGAAAPELTGGCQPPTAVHGQQHGSAAGSGTLCIPGYVILLACASSSELAYRLGEVWAVSGHGGCGSKIQQWHHSSPVWRVLAPQCRVLSGQRQLPVWHTRVSWGCAMHNALVSAALLCCLFGCYDTVLCAV